MDIKRLQKSVHPVMSRVSVERVARSLAPTLRFEPEAFEVMRSAAEAYAIDLFQRSMIVAVNRGSQTLHRKDLHSTLAVLHGVGPHDLLPPQQARVSSSEVPLKK
tara:strand:- start:7999 stop:8313 length:315 start_codon:yes stop_codon:yes gene_type:complete